MSSVDSGDSYDSSGASLTPEVDYETAVVATHRRREIVEPAGSLEALCSTMTPRPMHSENCRSPQARSSPTRQMPGRGRQSETPHVQDANAEPVPPAELHRGNRRGAQPLRPVRRPRPHPLPAGAERLPAHRPRQVDLPELRPRPEVRRQVQPPLRRHQPDQGGAGVRRRHPRRRPLARRPTGRAASSTPPTTSASSTSGPSSSSQAARPMSATCRPRRSPSTAAASRAARKARTATARSRRTSTCSAA